MEGLDDPLWPENYFNSLNRVRLGLQSSRRHVTYRLNTESIHRGQFKELPLFYHGDNPGNIHQGTRTSVSVESVY